jgi:hypothetical protein
MKIEIQKGEFAEGMPWSIETDYLMTESEPCKHCVDMGVNVYGERIHTVRAVVKAKNEGGHNCTIVCLDCILENASNVK